MVDLRTCRFRAKAQATLMNATEHCVVLWLLPSIVRRVHAALPNARTHRDTCTDASINHRYRLLADLPSEAKCQAPDCFTHPRSPEAAEIRRAGQPTRCSGHAPRARESYRRRWGVGGDVNA